MNDGEVSLFSLKGGEKQSLFTLPFNSLTYALARNDNLETPAIDYRSAIFASFLVHFKILNFFMWVLMFLANKKKTKRPLYINFASYCS